MTVDGSADSLDRLACACGIASQKIWIPVRVQNNLIPHNSTPGADTTIIKVPMKSSEGVDARRVFECCLTPLGCGTVASQKLGLECALVNKRMEEWRCNSPTSAPPRQYDAPMDSSLRQHQL